MELTLIKPSVEIWNQNDDMVAHVARCARVCYASDKGKDQILVNNLINNNHLSMFRHYTKYYIIPIKDIDDDLKTIINIFNNSEYCEVDNNSDFVFVVLNYQYVLEHKYLVDEINKYKVSELEFCSFSTGKEMRRITIKCVTQISTSRELNRVSPNNIAEQSTRYVNFNKKGGSICCPHWLIDEMDNDSMNFTEQDLQQVEQFENECRRDYLIHCYKSFELYNSIVDNLILTPQDARGVLPLDTSTICVYTYSIREWKHIIDLRYYGTTGKPQPNAKLIAGMIKDEINNLGYML